MAKKPSKRREALLKKVDASKEYGVDEAMKTLKDLKSAKFHETVEVALNLNVDPRHADQMIRGSVVLPHGTGKSLKVLALVSPDKEDEAKKAGADYIGLDEFIDKIKNGWVDVDVIVTMPSIMGKIGALGRVLGPRGLMPNPKLGTVTNNIQSTVKSLKSGQIEIKSDKDGNVAASIGKKNFLDNKIKARIIEPTPTNLTNTLTTFT